MVVTTVGYLLLIYITNFKSVISNSFVISNFIFYRLSKFDQDFIISVSTLYSSKHTLKIKELQAVYTIPVLTQTLFQHIQKIFKEVLITKI